MDTGTIYTYVLAKHYNMAPCISNGLLTLALCKNKIRTAVGEKANGAGVGDKLVGLWWSHKDQVQYIRFIAVVCAIITLEEYYAVGSIYRSRPDCIYTWQDGTMIHNGGRFHNDDSDEENAYSQSKDRQGYVLVCDTFRFYDYNEAPPACYLKSRCVRNHLKNQDADAKMYIKKLLEEAPSSLDTAAAAATAAPSSAPSSSSSSSPGAIVDERALATADLGDELTHYKELTDQGMLDDKEWKLLKTCALNRFKDRCYP